MSDCFIRFACSRLVKAALFGLIAFGAFSVSPAKAQLVVDAQGRVLLWSPEIGEYEDYSNTYFTDRDQAVKLAKRPVDSIASQSNVIESSAYDFSCNCMRPVYAPVDEDDPFIQMETLHDSGHQTTDSLGNVAGPVSSHMSDLGGGGSAYFTRSFAPAANQSFTAGVYFRYDGLRADYNLPAASESSKQGIYTVSGLARYDIGATYLKAALAGNWGDGSLSGTMTNGNFNMHGYATTLTAGHVFTPFAPAGVSTLSLPAKAPPIRSTWGALAALNLDLSTHIGYVADTANGFTDTTGFTWGAEQMNFWYGGADAKLFEHIVSGDSVLTPFIAGSLDSQFNYSHTLFIPTQPGFAADTIFLGAPQTFVGGRLGIDVSRGNGWSYGAEAFYDESSEYRNEGVRAYIRTPILQWIESQFASR